MQVMKNKKPLLVLTGPTAVGKTELSLKLAEAVDGSIISADSMQVYRHLDIGSAKIMPEERRGIPHYLIDVLEPTEDFDVTIFQKLARDAMREIWEEGRIPILVGGTGFYIQAVLRDIDFSDDAGRSTFRKRMEQIAEKEGPAALHRLLEERDPESAQAIHPNNIRRTIRALEYFEETGEPISAHNAEQRLKESPYTYLYFVLNDDRQRLYERIDRRVDRMIASGLVDEVKSLAAMGVTEECGSMKGLGYKELFPYLRGEETLGEAVDIIKRDTRHFAKRQLTWFRREKDVIWIDKPAFDYDEDRMLRYMLELWEKKKGSRQDDGRNTEDV